jgi:hypothetical protein
MAPLDVAEIGASAPYLYDSVAVMQQTLAAAAALSIALPLSASSASTNASALLLDSIAAQPSFDGASGNLDLICAAAPTVSALATLMFDVTYVSQFAALDWSNATYASEVYRSTLQRLVTGAATLWNAQGAAFALVGAFTPAAVTAVQARVVGDGWAMDSHQKDHTHLNRDHYQLTKLAFFSIRLSAIRLLCLSKRKMRTYCVSLPNFLDYGLFRLHTPPASDARHLVAGRVHGGARRHRATRGHLDADECARCGQRSAGFIARH